MFLMAEKAIIELKFTTAYDTWYYAFILQQHEMR